MYHNKPLTQFFLMIEQINKNNFWNIDQPDSICQPDLFGPHTRNEQTRQTRHNPTSFNNKFQSQNSINTQSYQTTQMQKEIPLPCYLQQHEITKTQLTIFSQKPNAVESLQMTMNSYLMDGSSIPSNKALMIFSRRFFKRGHGEFNFK